MITTVTTACWFVPSTSIFLLTFEAAIAIWMCLSFWMERKDNWINVTLYLNRVHWLPVKEHIQFKILLYVFKCLNGHAPSYLASCFTRYHQTPTGLRSARDSTRLSVPKFSQEGTPICCRSKFLVSSPGSMEQFTYFYSHSKLSVIIQKMFKNSPISSVDLVCTVYFCFYDICVTLCNMTVVFNIFVLMLMSALWSLWNGTL